MTDPLWQPLFILQDRFEANCESLATHNPNLAAQLRSFKSTSEYFIRASANQITLGRRVGQIIEPVPVAVPPPVAQQVVQNVFPKRTYDKAILVTGIDQGWIWQFLYDLPPNDPMQPGHRPPLYLLAGTIEQLWTMIHFHDWKELLADPRVRLFAGPDAVQQLRESLLQNMVVPWPKMSMTIDATLWPTGTTLDAMLTEANAPLSARLATAKTRLRELYSWTTPETIATRLRSGEPLRILGITSRYTTFLQHSMRDWLSAFDRLGHQTRLLIEGEDYQCNNNLVFADVCGEFQPDLVLMIDHYRSEFGGLPDAAPCVMWVQDMLPNIFSNEAGAAQTDRDYCVGFGRLHLSTRCNYPAGRFLPTPMGINDERFALGEASADELKQFGCDVSYVSHASTPADVLIKNQIDRLGSPAAVRFFKDVFDRMRGHYDSGGLILSEPVLRRLIDQSLQTAKCNLDKENYSTVHSFLTTQVNNAIVRHQTLLWLSDLGIDLHLYGRGWENHPRLRRHAKGIADNKAQLRSIYLASKINIQVTPFGAVHQRLMDGLACGAFFLVRYNQGDAVGTLHKQVWEWCCRNNIQSEQQLRSQAPAEICEVMTAIDQLLRFELASNDMKLFDILQVVADSDFMISASTVWPEYGDVSFATRDELSSKLSKYMDAPAERRRIALSMRERIIERASYRGISQRLLNFIANHLASMSRTNHQPLAA